MSFSEKINLILDIDETLVFSKMVKELQKDEDINKAIDDLQKDSKEDIYYISLQSNAKVLIYKVQVRKNMTLSLSKATKAILIWLSSKPKLKFLHAFLNSLKSIV